MKIICNIATTGDREFSLNKVLDSLKAQSLAPDEINIYDNNKENIDLDAKGKFYFLTQYSEPVYYFTLDDDILYPKTYIQDMVDAIEKHQCIVTHHGRKLIGENRLYYQGHKSFRCMSNNIEQTYIDVTGTGVTAFRTDYFNPAKIVEYEQKRMVDLIFSLEAALQDKKILILKHAAGYIRDLSTVFPQNSSCFSSGVNSSQAEQIKLANQIYKINHKQ